MPGDPPADRSRKPSAPAAAPAQPSKTVSWHNLHSWFPMEVMYVYVQFVAADALFIPFSHQVHGHHQAAQGEEQSSGTLRRSPEVRCKGAQPQHNPRPERRHGTGPAPSHQDNFRPVAVVQGQTGDVHAEYTVVYRADAVVIGAVYDGVFRMNI